MNGCINNLICQRNMRWKDAKIVLETVVVLMKALGNTERKT